MQYKLDEIMVKWSKKTYILDDIFSDDFTMNGGMGSCGSIVYTFEDIDEKDFL